MISQKLKEYLERQNADYEIVLESEIAGRKDRVLNCQAPLTQFAKVVVVKANGKDVMVVLPSNYQVDFSKISLFLDTDSVVEEKEEEAAGLFPDCETGALPALGWPYNLPCLVDETLLDGADIFFDAGNHQEKVKITSDEYWRVARAEIGDYRIHRL